MDKIMTVEERLARLEKMILPGSPLKVMSHPTIPWPSEDALWKALCEASSERLDAPILLTKKEMSVAYGKVKAIAEMRSQAGLEEK